MTQIEPPIKSILAIDYGNVTTTASLIERVEEHYRVTATSRTPSSHEPPWQDMTLAILTVIRQIEKETGQTILAGGNWPIVPRNANQQGVDAFLVVSSAAPPLPLALVGLTQDITLASARRAAATIYASITNELALDNGAENYQRNAENRIQQLREGQPETILLVGGADGGAERPLIDMANIVAMAIQVLWQVKKPNVLFAGNANVQAQIAEILQPVANLSIVDNLRPTLETENLAAIQLELEKFYMQRKMARLPGFDKLQKWSRLPILPTGKSFEKVITYLGRRHTLNVIGLDLGSGATHIATQAAEHQASIIRTDAGMGHSLAMLLKQTPLEKFQRWLPFEITLEAVHNQLLNKCLHPASLPTDHESLMLEYAIAREALRLTMTQVQTAWQGQSSLGKYGPQWHWLIGAGQTLTEAPNFGHTSLVMIDGVEPWGVTKLTLDIGNVTKLLGVIAAIEPVAAVEIAAHPGAFLNLGTLIAPLGHGPAGKKALNLKIIGEDEEIQTVDIAYGSIQRFDLPPGKKATVEIRPTRFFDIGLGQPGRGAVAEVEGGIVGLIVDARGRPLRLPQDDALRREQLSLWAEAVGVKSV